MRWSAAFLCCVLLAGCSPSDDEKMSANDVALELDQIRIEPGLWALSSEIVDVSGPDLPRELRNRMVGPRSRIRHCITPDQAANPSASFLAARSDGQCRYRRHSVRDGIIEGEMDCPGASARMDGRFTPDAYRMNLHMESPIADGAVMRIEVVARGRRIGECASEAG